MGVDGKPETAFGSSTGFVFIDLIGGTTGSDGAVPFAASGALTSDITNFFWDDTNNRLGIGTNAPESALEVVGPSPGAVGGFPAGQLEVRGTGTTANSNAVITFHNSFNGNTQIGYIGSTSSSNQNIGFINRQNADLTLHTNDLIRVTVEAAGNVVLANQIKISGGVPGLNKVLTSDAAGLATWETPLAPSGWVDDGTTVRLSTSTDNVGIGTASVEASAKLQIDSTENDYR